jgi:acyl-coenzyme A thioesterase PaaI-like protein
MAREYIQDHMPGNVCFGCGTLNPEGLQIKSFWEGEESICHWQSEEKYHGWQGVLNGGILATVIDCHCTGTALAAAYRAEGRPYGSDPIYRYATGTLTVRYLKPTPNNNPITLRAQVVEMRGRKATIACQVYAGDLQTAEAEGICIRVIEGEPGEDSPFR